MKASQNFSYNNVLDINHFHKVVKRAKSDRLNVYYEKWYAYQKT